MLDQPSDFLATELLAELKEENIRKDNMVKKLLRIVIIELLTIIIIVGGFLLYMNQYDYSSEQTVSGVYAVVDSEGNVVASDFTAEEVAQIMEVISNGEGED